MAMTLVYMQYNYMQHVIIQMCIICLFAHTWPTHTFLKSYNINYRINMFVYKQMSNFSNEFIFL